MHARGFSLIELLVGVAVSTVVVATGVALLLGTQRLFVTGSADRAMQETARVALDEVTRNLRVAGYGLDPTFAFDFGQATTTMDRVPAGTSVRFGGYQCTTPVTCRDSVAGPDELVFYARDPSFEKDLTGPVGVSSLTLAGPFSPGTKLDPGQILQVMCYGTAGQWLWAYVTVDTVDTTNAAQWMVTLKSGTGLPNDFPFQNSLLAGQACFGSGTRRAFKIDRYRYFVAAVDATGAQKAWGTAGTRPFLMLDQGLPTSPVVIAPDVEDLQVGYVFPLADATSGAQLAGTTSGVALTADANGIDLSPALGIPAFSTPSLDPIRTTHHPANIRAVRVAITVRSERSDPKVSDATVPLSLNRPDLAGEAGYRRMVFETTTYVHNLEARLPVFPMVDPANCANNSVAAGVLGPAGNCGGG